MNGRTVTRFVVLALFVLVCVIGVGCYHPHGGWHRWWFYWAAHAV